jgi:hypothetical protein
MKLSTNKRRFSATTLIEVMVACVLIAGFFGTIFEVNSVCLRYINASKEAVAAILGVQDRTEQLRNLTFVNLTNSSSLLSLMATPSNSSAFGSTKPTEYVTITTFNTSSSPGVKSGTGMQIRRDPGASVTPVVVTSDATVATATTVLVEVKYTWNSTFGSRPLTEATATLISSGTKK